VSLLCDHRRSGGILQETDQGTIGEEKALLDVEESEGVGHIFYYEKAVYHKRGKGERDVGKKSAKKV